jgi:type VI secretion system secreted protein Hcp
MAADMFLKLEGIKGESTDSKHANEIEILSYSFGVTQTGTGSHGTGHGGGKAHVQDFQITHHTDAASPSLFAMCASGKHITKGTFIARKAGGDQQEYLTVHLSDVLISSVQSGGSGGSDIPLEQVSLNFAKIEIDYKPQKADGTLGAGVKGGWDIKQSKAT